MYSYTSKNIYLTKPNKKNYKNILILRIGDFFFLVFVQFISIVHTRIIIYTCIGKCVFKLYAPLLKLDKL